LRSRRAGRAAPGPLNADANRHRKLVAARVRVALDTHSSLLLSRVRKLCLSLPDASETSSWGHPNFCAGKRTFVTIERFGGLDNIAFRLHPVEVEDLERQPGFVRTPYGKGQWVSLRTKPRPKWSLVKSLVLKSYRLVASKRMIAALEAGPHLNKRRAS
jgi:predicted DNA-binding protein (MmcQ/YjbR family)